MKKDNTGKKHIINVLWKASFTAISRKTDIRIPIWRRFEHVNAYRRGNFGKRRNFMNAVDTGWVTDEDPAELAKRKQEEQDFQPPLDIVDGAAQ
jgi:hypothetical protein